MSETPIGPPAPPPTTGAVPSTTLWPAVRELRGQVGIVTGAGRGIGRAVAERLAADGMSLALMARSADELERACTACSAAGGSALAMVVDVADPAAVHAAVERVERDLGVPDLLVSNAGVAGPEEPLWEAGYEAWWRTVQVNLGGALAGAAAVLPAMVRRNRGRLVQMISLVAARDYPAYGSYAVSKAGVLRLGGVLAASLAGTGVVVLDVGPGLVRTAMTNAMPMWAGTPDEAWTPVEKTAALVCHRPGAARPADGPVHPRGRRLGTAGQTCRGDRGSRRPGAPAHPGLA